MTQTTSAAAQPPMCGRRSAMVRPSQPLIHIRSGYRIQWHELALSVESDSLQWTARVARAATCERLYEGHRSGLQAAKVAALEFAMIAQLDGGWNRSPEAVASQLPWQEYW